MRLYFPKPSRILIAECPSGGDWSIHRGAALFVEASSDITIEGLTFDQVSGNALMFSNEVMDSTVRKCLFKDVGDSAISMLGSTQQMVGTAGKGLYPSHNLIESNVVDVVGVYGKQTSAYFKAKSRANVVRKNVFMNGPRAGVRLKPLPLDCIALWLTAYVFLKVNFNDGTAGGEVLEMNLVMVRTAASHNMRPTICVCTFLNPVGSRLQNFVRESGDHGMFVSDATRNFAL